MKIKNDEDLERLNARFARHAQDFDDLQNELAGRSVGRVERFLPGGANSAGSSGKSKKERAETLTRLQLLLADPAYAALYRETVSALTEAQSKLEIMLERVRLGIEQNAATLEDMQDRAARLEDGTRVYRDKDGQVRNEDGRIFTDALVAGIVWNGTETSFEDIQANIARRDRLNNIEADILAGQAEIGEMQVAMDDDDDPRTEAQMEDFKNRAKDIMGNAEQRMEAELQTSDSAPETSEQSFVSATKLTVPEI